MDFSQFQHDAISEKIVDICKRRTQNDNSLFFRIQVAYFMGKVTATMNTKIALKTRGILPVNVYAINLAPSGFGKGHSTKIIESEILNGFRKRFMEETFPVCGLANLDRLAMHRANRTGETFDEALAAYQKEFKTAGKYLYSFDEATQPAVKQMRHTVLLAGCGALNLEVDEIGSNIQKQVDSLGAFLELYDVGLIKPKLTKNTTDSTRHEDLEGRTPANMLMFGTPANLLNGSEEENLFMTLQEIGYARRSIYGYSDASDETDPKPRQTPEQIYAQLANATYDVEIAKLYALFEDLADAAYLNREIPVPDTVEIELIRYQQYCEDRAAEMTEHDEILKAEMAHRYFKTIKIAGAYAFIAQEPEVKMEHLHSAIALVEESGEALKAIMNRDKPYEKLAKFVATVGRDVTNADFMEKLPFYKKASGAMKRELMSLARAWGYGNNIIIKQYTREGIDFYHGETLEPTNLDEIRISYSVDISQFYRNQNMPFKRISELCHNPQQLQFTNHWLEGGEDGKGHRETSKCVQGFNCIVLDIDDSEVTPNTASKLLHEYTHYIYTTKSHGINNLNSYRIVMPINYVLYLDEEEFHKFMDSLYSWLPFNVDTQAKNRTRKWATHANGQEILHETDTLLDVLPFIPQTSRNDEYEESISKLGSYSNVERWFAQRITTGNRNNMMLNFAMMLVDSGKTLTEVQQSVIDFNSRLKPSLSQDEIHNTIFKTVAKRYMP